MVTEVMAQEKRVRLVAEERKGESSQAHYSNFFRIGQNEVEFLIEFGQDFQERATPTFHTRIIMSPDYAKEFSRLLRKAIHEHESRQETIHEEDL